MRFFFVFAAYAAALRGGPVKRVRLAVRPAGAAPASSVPTERPREVDRNVALEAARRQHYAARVLEGAPERVERVPGDAAARRRYARDGVCVLENFFDAALFGELEASAAATVARLKPETMESVAVGRWGCFLEPGDAVVAALACERTVQRLRYVVGDARLEAADYPVEMRRYPVGSAMGWHRDEALYEEPQIECVFTLANSSDSETQWETADGSLERKWMPPNSLLVVKAEGAAHGVTPVTEGDRLIAKYVLSASRVKLQAWYDNLDSYREAPQP